MDFSEHDKLELVKKTRLLKQLDHMYTTVDYLEQMLHIMAEMIETENVRLKHYSEDSDDKSKEIVSDV